MKVIAAGSFRVRPAQEEVQLQSDSEHPAGCLPLGISRITYEAKGVYRVSFSVDTERNGTHRQRWYVQAREVAACLFDVEWKGHREAIVTFKDPYTKQLKDPNGWHILITSDTGHGFDPRNLIVYSSINPDGTPASTEDHPFGPYPSCGVETIDKEGQPDNFLLSYNTDVTRAGGSWFFWGKASGAEIAGSLSHNDIREGRIEIYSIDTPLFLPVLPTEPIHFFIYKFGDDQPESLAFESVPASVPVGQYLNLVPNANYSRDREAWGNASVQDVTHEARWSSSDEAVLQTTGSTGQYSPVAEGTATISFTFQGLTITTPPITVVAA